MEDNKKKKFPVWKTLTIGGKSKKQVRAELKKNYCYVPYGTSCMIRRIALSEKQIEIPLVKVQVRDIIFDNGNEVTIEKFFSDAKKNGLGLCPAEVGLYVCLMMNSNDEKVYREFFEEFYAHYLLVAMEPVSDSNYSAVFSAGWSDLEGLNLGVHIVDLKKKCLNPWDKFVFVDEQSLNF